MKTGKKIFLVFAIVVLTLLTGLFGAILYYYFHPSAIKSFVEKSISRSTGTSFSIEKLSYALKPLRVHAKGIEFKPGQGHKGFYLELPDLTADMALEGPIGQKTLALKRLTVNGFSIRMSEELSLPTLDGPEESPSLFSNIIRKLISLCLFKDIEFQAAHVVNGEVSAQFQNQLVRIDGIQASLNAAKEIEVSCGAKIQMPAEKMVFNAPELRITTDRAISLINPELRFFLTVRKAAFQSPTAEAGNVDVRAKLTYHRQHKTLSFQPMEVHSNRVRLKLVSESESIPLNLHLKTEGQFGLGESSLRAYHFDLNVTDIGELKGELTALLGSQKRVGLKLLRCHVFFEKLRSFLPDSMTAGLDHLIISGPISFEGDVDGLREGLKWHWHCDLQTLLHQTPFSYKTEQIDLNGKLTGNIQVGGSFPDLGLAATIDGEISGLSGQKVALGPFKVSLSMTGKHPIYQLNEITTMVPQVKFVLGERDVRIEDIRIWIQKGTFDGEKKSLLLPIVQFNSSLVKNLTLSLNLEGKQAAVKLKGNKIDLLGSVRRLDLLPNGWRFSGLDFIDLNAVINGTENCSIDAKLAFHELAFESPDESVMGEKLSVQTEMNGKLDPKTGHMNGLISIQIDRGEILYDRFYFDLNTNPFTSLCTGRWDIAKKSLQLSNLKAGLKDILTLDIHGSVPHNFQDRKFNLVLNIPPAKLKPVFQSFVLEPFQTEKPFLSSLNLAGIISADLKLEGTKEDWIISGEFNWDDGQVSSAESGFYFEGIDLSLPLWYQTKKRVGSPIETRKGALSIKAMSLPFLPRQSLRMELDAGANVLFVKAPTNFSIPGGIVKLGPVTAKDIFGPRPTIQTSLLLNNIELNPLLSEIWQHSVHGTLYGKLDPTILDGDSLTAQGKIKVSVFDGNIIFSDLRAEGLFTSSPLFALDAQCRNLNLAELTGRTPFGRIEGVLQGHINGLEIAYGQPQKFDLLLETVKKRGIRQRISVKAVENIARIGGGQSPFMGLAGGFAALFKEFPYRQIGVHARLENDVFRINGTIREGGDEYFVKRGSISGVDVVNQNPDNRISFKDMVKRIKRVTRGGGPIIR